MSTVTARYFLNLYGCSTLQEAVEMAAECERGPRLPFKTGFEIPVDVEKIATRKGITIGKELSSANFANAVLEPHASGFIVRMARDSTPLRKRYSLAHEIGHTFFRKKDERRVSKVESSLERETEEFICDSFAAALLMPRPDVISFIQGIPSENPWDIFTYFEDFGRRSQVSIPFLISRIGQVNTCVSGASLVFLCLRYFPNKYTLKEPRLRVDYCSTVGILSNVRVWRNRTVERINLLSGQHVFEYWANSLAEGVDLTGGKYVGSDLGHIERAKSENTNWVAENVCLSVISDGKWHNEQVEMLASSCLYARKGWSKEKAYVFSVLKRRERAQK